MTGDEATIARLAAAVALAAAPLAWTVAHRGARRRRERGGLADGVLLLGALLLAAMALVLAAVAGARLPRERRERATWPTVAAVVERCAVATTRSAGRLGGPVHELACTVRYRAGGRELAREVTVGHPERREAYDAWIARHPPGATIPLRHAPDDPAALAGLAELVPATTTAAAAAGRSLAFALVGAALLLASRLVARYRGR